MVTRPLPVFPPRRSCRTFSARACWVAATMVLLMAAAWLPGVRGAYADDWPTYRHDIARSGVSADQLEPPLAARWVFVARYAPRPAWGNPKPVPIEDLLELRRVHFDDVFQPVVARGRVFFGSSAEDKVYCLDAQSGRILWTRILGGPVRLAPMVVGERLYVGADDGVLRCLDAQNGAVIWQFQAAPEMSRRLGQGRMISLWPLRSGALVDQGVVYLAAGFFPAEGVFLYALDAQTGRVLWCNDTGGEQPQSRISPQGYLLASEENLFVPMGRVSPASFSRRDGRMVKASPFFGKTIGGSFAVLAGGDMFTGTEEMVGCRADSLERFAQFPARRLVATEQHVFLATGSQLVATPRSAPGKDVLWATACPCADELILAGEVLIAGGENRLAAVDSNTGKVLWLGDVEGSAKGLAAAGGLLFASTDTGRLYCFAPAPPGANPEEARAEAAEASAPPQPQPATIREPTDTHAFEDRPGAAEARRAAQWLLEQSGVRRGYGLVLGIETGQLVYELARQSELKLCAVSPDEKRVADLRVALDRAGMYGTRVVVDCLPLDNVPYGDYFANLIVSETALLRGELPTSAGEAFRMLKPRGGVMLIGQMPAADEQAAGARQQGGPLDAGRLQNWLAEAQLDPQEATTEIIEQPGTWAKLVRGLLKGEGNWTHQYANAANTACGDDQRVRCPLGVLWFGEPGPGMMPNRHVRAAGPLVMDGRLFVPGEHVLMAYDTYNGVKLWEVPIQGAARFYASHDASDLAAGPDGLFVAVADRCLRLDPATGKTLSTYRLPPMPEGGWQWGYLACEKGLLVGSSTTNRRDSTSLFAFAPASGKLLWQVAGRQIPHNAIVLDQGSLYYVSSEVTDQQCEQVLAQRRQEIDRLPEAQRPAAEKELAEADVRLVVCLDARTGQRRWSRAVDLTDCGGPRSGVSGNTGVLTAMANNGVLVFFGVYLDGHHWQQFFAGQFKQRRILALATDDGRTLWTRRVGFRVRPLIIGDTLHAEPWAFDLHTGAQRTRENPVTGLAEPWQFARPGHHCGCPAAAPNCLFFRSYTLGYYDLAGDYGTMHFGAQRPGCWINFIPAAGLLLMPEASTGCMCPFPTMTTVVLKPTGQQKGWAWYSAAGPLTPVKRLGINFGAPGDRRDQRGKLWLGYPRPGGSLVLNLPLSVGFHPGGGFTQRNSTYTPVAGTAEPWLFTCAARGLQRCVVPLLSEGDGRAMYRVRLLFADLENDQPGQRLFDVRVQGQTRCADFDIVQSAGGPRRAAALQFENIEVQNDLVLELLPKPSRAAGDQLPVLQALEIERQKMLSPGCTVPRFLVSVPMPRQTQNAALANFCEELFRGTLELDAPEGFAVSPQRVTVELSSGTRQQVPVEVSLAGDVAAGKYRLVARLVRSDGTLALESSSEIEHLGRRGRVVLPATADAHVVERYAARNFGSATQMLVDGGDQKMGDRDHALCYLRFRLDVPGKPVKVVLRLVNAGNPTGDSGRVCLVEGPWDEKKLTYENRPPAGRELARLGAVAANQVVEVPLDIEVAHGGELSLVVDPASTDGTDYLSRESTRPPGLVVEFE